MTETAGLAWYCSADVSSRDFCNLCGSGLFFEHGPDQPLGIAAGAFDREPDFELAVHIWTDEAGNSYRVTDDLPRYTEAEWRRDGWQRYRHGKDDA
ncbi:MAG: GFA family protein [Kiloniellales bacterium]